MPGGIDQIGEPFRFAFGDRQALRRQPVVAPAILVGLVVQRDRQLLDQAVDQHALNRAVERARAEARLAVGEALDVLHDAVAVRFAVGKRQEDVEDSRRQQRRRLVVRLCSLLRRRAKGANVWSLRRGCNHGGYMYRGAILLSRQRRRARYRQSGALNDDAPGHNRDAQDEGITAGGDDGDDVRSGRQREVLVVALELFDAANRGAIHIDLGAPRLDIELHAAGRRVRGERRLLERHDLGQCHKTPVPPDWERPYRPASRRRTRTRGGDRGPRGQTAANLCPDGCRGRKDCDDDADGEDNSTHGPPLLPTSRYRRADAASSARAPLRMCSRPRLPSWQPYSKICCESSLVNGMVNVNGLVHTSGSLNVTSHCTVFADVGVKRSVSVNCSLLKRLL